MDIRELINKAYEKDATGFEEAFEELMADRLETVIGEKYEAMFGEAKKDYDEDEDEDDENDEDEDED